MARDLKRKRTQNTVMPAQKRRQARPRPIEDGDLEDKGLDVANETVGDDTGVSESEDGSDDGEDDHEDIEEWTGIAEEHTTQTNNSTEADKPRKPVKTLVGGDLRNVREAKDLFISSSFKLQIDALLPNVRPKSSRIAPLERFLFSLHSLLTSLPPIDPQHPCEAAQSLLDKNVVVPYPIPAPTKETNWKVSFESPSDVTLVGSWPNKCSVKGRDGVKLGVDLAVEMPASLFQEKDYLNSRFFHKRAYYLACIAAAIMDRKNGLNATVHYHSSGDPRLTTLVVHSPEDESPSDFTKLDAEIRIIPTLPYPPPFPLQRLSPSQSNLRTTSNASSEKDHSPTPLYNNILLLACTPKHHLLSVHRLKTDVPAFTDALTLLRIWANQRGYGEGTRLCVRGFQGRGTWWVGLLEMLVRGEQQTQVGFAKAGSPARRKPLGKGLSSYQMFRAALDFLAKHDFEQGAVYVKSEDGYRYAPEEYRAHHEAVFVDSSSLVNLLAGVPLSSLEMLKHDAQITLDVLDNTSASHDSFQETFLKDQRNAPPRFDSFMCIDLSSAKLTGTSVGSISDYGSIGNALIGSLTSIVRRGLGNRAKAIVILHPTSTSRPISQGLPSEPHIIYVGVIYNTEHTFRLVEHGPAVDDPDTSFCEFWGDKAELRRFKDGSIVQSVVWDVKNSDERAHIPLRIIEHLLHRHFDIAASAVQNWQTPFDSLLRLPESISSVVQQNSGVTTGFKGALTALDELVRVLKSSDDLPLSILNVHPVSEYLRYTSVFSPIPLPASLSPVLPKCARYLPTMEIILEFEKSGKWPDELRAIQKIKLAFFERIAAALMQSQSSTRATVVVGDELGASDIQDQARLEIVTAQGWAFSARIWHDREATLLDRLLNDKSHVSQKYPKQDESSAKERQSVLEAREVYTRRFIHAPKHHRAVANLCHRFTAYAGTVRLVKRWLSSHWLLQGHVSEEIIEIICAGAFLDGKTQGNRPSIPGSKERGFAKVVEFLKDWKIEEGLFVPLYDGTESEGTSSDRPTTFAGSKAGVWKVSTEEDREGHVWTSDGPDVVVAHRVRSLAKATWDMLQGVENRNLEVKKLFVHPTDNYDFIIQLEPSLLPRYFQNVAADQRLWARNGKYANLSFSDEELLQPGFDPAQLLFNDLKRTYCDTFKLFYDPYGGTSFGAVWVPSLKNPRPFRVLGGFSSIPAGKDDKTKDKSAVKLNERAIINEVERLGIGLVNAIIA